MLHIEKYLGILNGLRIPYGIVLVVNRYLDWGSGILKSFR